MPRSDRRIPDDGLSEQQVRELTISRIHCGPMWLKASTTNGMVIQELWIGHKTRTWKLWELSPFHLSEAYKALGENWPSMLDYLATLSSLFTSPVFIGPQPNNKIVGCNFCRWWLLGLKRNRTEFRWQRHSAHQSIKHVMSRLTIIFFFQWFLGPRWSCHPQKARHYI